jgi:hypothetical protein
VRPIEREIKGRDDPEAQAIRSYRTAVRGAGSDDSRPLTAPGPVVRSSVPLPAAVATWLGGSAV